MAVGMAGAGKTVGLLPWNPDAAVDPARQAVVEVGVTGDRVRLFVAKYYGPEASGGFLTPDAAERLGRHLIALAGFARLASPDAEQ